MTATDDDGWWIDRESSILSTYSDKPYIVQVFDYVEVGRSDLPRMCFVILIDECLAHHRPL